MRIEYSDGRRVDVADETEARAILDAEFPAAVYGEWQPINDTRDRLLVWADDDTAGTEGEGDDGSRAWAEIVRDPVTTTQPGPQGPQREVRTMNSTYWYETHEDGYREFTTREEAIREADAAADREQEQVVVIASETGKPIHTAGRGKYPTHEQKCMNPERYGFKD